MTQPTALDLLRRAEQHLSALHGSVGRHDNLAANLACGGCELRDTIAAALPKLPAEPRPAVGQTELRAQIAAAMRPHFSCIDPADPEGPAPCSCGWPDPGPDATPDNDLDSHIADVVLSVLPAPAAPVPPADRTALRGRIVEALYERERPPRDPAWAEAYAMDREVFEAMAGAVLAVLPAPVDRAAVLTEAAECAYRIARRLDDQHHDERAHGAWDVENVLRAELRQMAAETWKPEPAAPQPSPYEQLANRLDTEAARRVKAAWSPQEATAAREWGNVADFVRALGRQQQPAGERPHRGDAVEAWLKAQRDRDSRGTVRWDVLDDALDLYRLHADTGTPLGEHVCEGRGCDCGEAGRG